jgi:hypothetical protein
MRINCDDCSVRGLHCGDCVVPLLLSLPAFSSGLGPDDYDIDEREHAALGVLAEGGLVPPLRLIQGSGTREIDTRGASWIAQDRGVS